MKSEETGTDFLAGGGETGALMRAHDWSATPLGPAGTWPQSLKTTVALMLSSRFPMFTAWGPRLTFLYNDAYTEVLGGKHPEALGRAFEDIWTEIWSDIEPMVEAALDGRSTYFENLPLVMNRKGQDEQTWFTFSYSPVRDDQGDVAGMFCACVETTGQVRAEARQAALIALEQVLSLETDAGAVTHAACRLLGTTLGAWRVGFGEIDVGAETIFVADDWAQGDARSVSGLHQFRTYGTYVADLTAGRAVAIDNVDVDPRTAADPAPLKGYGIQALMDVPILEKGVVVAEVFVHSNAPRAWSEDDIALARAFAERTRAVASRRKAEQETRVREAELQRLADTIPLLVSFIDRDKRYAFNNQAYNEWFGLAPGALRGRSMAEVVGEAAYASLQPTLERVLAGEAVTVEQTVAYAFGPRRHVQAEYIPRRDDHGEVDGFYAIVQDISERHQAELRQGVLLDLNDAVRDLTDPADIAHAASRILAEALAVSRVGYGVMDTVAETVTIERDYNAPGVQSLAGVIHFRQFGSYIEDLARGDTVILSNAADDPRIDDGGAALARISATSLINLPLIERGKVVALLFVNHAAPRAWSDADLTLVREVAERVRTASERARITTSMQESERRLGFLDRLAQASQPLTDADAILEVTTRMTAQHLDVTSCAYADMEADEDHFFIRGDWAAPGHPSIVGRYSLTDFGTLAVQELGAARPLVINDNLTEIAPEEAATFQAIGIGATICMPLVKDGRLTALMAVHTAGPRQWTDYDLALVREVTERSWAHIERVRSEADRQDSESRYRTLFDTVDEGFCIIEFIDGPDGPLSDYVHVEANKAAAEQVGLAGVAGHRIREIAPVDAQEWIDPYKTVLLTGEPVRFEKAFEATGRWLELAAFRIEPASRLQVAVLFKDLTSRRAAEIALRESEARFRNMADSTPMMMWVTDATGFCTYLNRTWYEFTGQTREQAEGFGWLDATHPDDKARAEDAFLSANAAQKGFRAEYRLRRADGVYRWAIDAASPRFDENGEYLGYVGSVIDIDERREIEDALRASESSLRALNAELEHRVIEKAMGRGQTWLVSPEFFAVADANGHFTDTNPAWQKVFGWTPEELSGAPFIDLVHPDDVALTLAAYDDLARGVPLLRFDNRYRTRDGDYRWLSWIAVPDDGKFYCSARDVTEDRSRADERDRLWSLSSDLLARADYEGGLSAVNPAWTEVLGWSEQELLANPYADIINPADVPATVAALFEMSETGKPTRVQNAILARDGQWKPIDWTVAPEPDGRNFIAVGRDLTADKAREAQLAATQEALRQSQKMEAVGQLTGGIAHDFNNLLAGISGSLELLSKRLSEGRLNGMERYIDAAQGSAQRAASLTQRLLAFSRRQTLDPKPTDVNRLINGMEDLIRRSVGPDVELEVVGAGGLWTTRIDQSQLENALLNLCINARDAMAPGGGRLTIETANKWLDDRAAKVRDLPPGQYVSLCVTDTGTGMPPEVQAQAFDPFFTTKPLGQGTGLGLSMIHGFVRQSGGQVRIYSEMGKGTTMCLYLPRYLGDLDGDEDTGVTPVAEGGHGETVLVIDDEETVRMLVAEVLGDAGYNVIEAPDGPSGLEILRSHRRIDLLVSDVGLPGGMNGRQVADAARVSRPDLKVLFITGYAENAAVGNGLLAPGMEVLTKPFVMGDLAAKVHDMIAG